MTKTPHVALLIAVSVLVAASLACSISLGGPKAPTELPPTEISPTSNPEEVLQTAVPENGGAGDFTLELTEAQLTDYLNEQLKSQPNPVLQNPRVVLKDGQIEIYGFAKQGILSGNVHIAATVSIDDQGKPKIKIVSADLGAVPIPSGLLDVFSNMLDETLTSKLGSYATGFRMEEIHISDGLMTIKGRLQ